jgi:copper resistance protein D
MNVRPVPALVVLIFAFTSSLFVFAASSQHDMTDMKEMSGMDHGKPADAGSAQSAAQELKDARVSEFNHHLAGFILFVASLFVLAEESLTKRWSSAKYAWPLCLLFAGIFVLVFSDAEMWPLGPQTPWYALTHSLEDLQHKGFAAILLAVGYVEFQRAKGRLDEVLPALCFPVLAIAGTVLLLFHVHSGDMNAPDAMKVMARIHTQHRWFAVVGLGIAVTKGFGETTHKWQQVFNKTWPTLLGVLGVLLMAYTEVVR